MNHGRVEERSSSRSRSPSTVRFAATSAILTDTLSRSDKALTSRTVDSRPGKKRSSRPIGVAQANEATENTPAHDNRKEQSYLTAERLNSEMPGAGPLSPKCHQRRIDRNPCEP